MYAVVAWGLYRHLTMQNEDFYEGVVSHSTKDKWVARQGLAVRGL